MASDSDDILVVDDQTSGPCRGAQQGGDVIALSDSDDDDVAVIPEAEHGATQDDAKCSMDCCGAVASIEEVQRAVENAAAGFARAAFPRPCSKSSTRACKHSGTISTIFENWLVHACLCKGALCLQVR